MTTEKQLTIGTLVLRLGLAFVFIFFGLNELHNPGQWIHFIPTWLAGTSASQLHFVLMNGLFEIVAAILLIVGAYTRISALLLALHLIGIAFTLGLNPVGVRDIGLMAATFSLAIIGAGMYSVDHKTMQRSATA